MGRVEFSKGRFQVAWLLLRRAFLALGVWILSNSVELCASGLNCYALSFALIKAYENVQDLLKIFSLVRDLGTALGSGVPCV